MAKARYYLRAKGKDGLSQIQAKFTYPISSRVSRRVTYSTGLFIVPELWSAKDHRVRRSFEALEFEWVNEQLGKLDKIFNEVYRDYLLKSNLGALSVEVFKDELDLRYAGYDKDSTALIGWGRQYLEHEYKKRIDYSKFVEEHIRRAIKLVEAYKPVTVSGVDFRYLSGFTVFLRSNGYTDNYIAKVLEKTRQLVKFASRQGMKVSAETAQTTNASLGVFKSKGFKIALTKQEIKKLYYTEYPKDHYRKVVDIFTVQCFTGLRYVNWRDVNSKNLITVDNKQLLDVTTAKGGKRVVLPVHPIILTVLERYGGSLPIISEQKTRDNLKIAAQIAGFTDTINKRQTKGKVISEATQRYKLFTCHVSRNSFNSNALDAGLPDRDIKKFMGHSSSDMTDIYDRRDLSRIALKYVGHPFFNEL